MFRISLRGKPGTEREIDLDDLDGGDEERALEEKAEDAADRYCAKYVEQGEDGACLCDVLDTSHPDSAAIAVLVEWGRLGPFFGARATALDEDEARKILASWEAEG